MRKIVIMLSLTLTGIVLFAQAFITPRMIDRRGGLTDDQYESLWAVGKNPTVSQATARDWLYRAARYQNVTNWLDLCGRSNDFAKVAYELHVQNERMSAAFMVATNAAARAVADAAVHSNRLARITEYLTAKRDEARLSTTKAIYNAIIEKLESE